MLYDILKNFKGSQDGATAEDFVAGTQRELTEWLATAAPPGAIRPAAVPMVVEIAPVAPEVKIAAVTMKRKK